jgi:hypothetical protein
MAAAELTFRDKLRPLASMSEAELEAAVRMLPPAIRERLAQGPLPRRFACGVCEAFGAAWYLDAEPDSSDPLWLVFGYHEVPKIDMQHRDDQFYGELANDVYRRCLVVYRAAGWTGEAEEPNA